MCKTRLVLLAFLCSLLPAWAAAQPVPESVNQADAWQPAEEFDYIGSDRCRTCHQDHYATWHRTYHRTMTQEATEDSVVGAFDGKAVTYWGQTIRPTRRGEEFVFEYLDAQGRVVGHAEIKRTVGSHRYQQYLAQAPSTGENYIRMQLLWHIGDARWVHMNGAFLYSDDQGPNQHVSTWNSNCIFCHNTQPRPNVQNYDDLLNRTLRGEMINFLDEARFDSEVSELGIACEACHGPGGEHARDMQNPFKRYWHAFNNSAPVDHIVYPQKLSPERSSQVCGQCHAQRVPIRNDLVRRWLSDGPTYRPGDDLLEHVRLIQPDTPGTAAKPDLYRLRFWPDGTPRLSAYEYTGLRQTACHTGSEDPAQQASCDGCHAAHGGSPEGMITEPNRQGAACLDCHQDIAEAPQQHTRHPLGFAGREAAESDQVDCVSCHMPRIVYGVMTIHRSHNIERPDPVDHALQNRPDACTSCHLDQTAAAAGSAVAGWQSGAGFVADTGIPEWLHQLLGGDPLQRAMAAETAGTAGVAVADKRWLVPPLLASLNDDYPAVRRFAKKSLQALDAELALGMADTLVAYDFIADQAQRRGWQRDLQRTWAGQDHGKPVAWLRDGRVETNILNTLQARANANTQRIEIGE